MQRLTGYLVATFLFFVMALSGCGGGGGGSAATSTPTPTPTVCVEDDWAPAQSTKPWWQKFTQTSAKCGTSREVDGTWQPWVDRAQFGTSMAPLFKNYSSVMGKIVASEDNAGGSVLFGQDVASKKGALLHADTNGNTLWTTQIDPQMGTAVVPHVVNCDGNNIPVAFEGLPWNDWNLTSFDMNGARNATIGTMNGPPPVSDDWRVRSAVLAIDGQYLVSGRIYQSGKATLTYAQFGSSATPLSTASLLPPEFITVDASGIIVVGNGSYMRYARDLTVLQTQTAWSTGTDPVIHDVKTVGGKTYIAGAVGGIVTVTELGNPAFRNTENIPVGADKIKLLADANGNILLYIGNRIGWLKKTTGETGTRMPVAVPSNLEAYVSGNNVLFLENGNKLYSLPLSQIPAD